MRYFRDIARTHEYDLSNQTFARWLNYSLKSTLVPFLDGTEPEGYEQAAPKLGMAPGTVAVTVHRMRARLRELLRAEVRQLCASAKEEEQEMKHLLEVWSR